MEKSFLYKYQPLWLNEFDLEEDLHILLQTFLEMNVLNILFIGEPGCGKTSLINALIHEYYGTIATTNNDNILYINNLKEQGITYYRVDVKTFCQTPSNISGKKKILVVDDIDFINEQSQQVFRNYIDKYSHNVHVIGSCINTQKVIDSLQSRLTIIKKHNLPENKLEKIIEKICRMEQISISPEVTDFIISISNKSVRIIINYLEKFKLLHREITIELANQVCTNISFYEFNQFTTICKEEQNLRKAITLIYSLANRGYSVMDILDNYFIYLKNTTLITEEEKYVIIPYICKYITIFNNVHEDDIELAHFTNNLIHIFRAHKRSTCAVVHAQ
jgi:DNA polymerase III delta prime subunit